MGKSLGRAMEKDQEAWSPLLVTYVTSKQKIDTLCWIIFKNAMKMKKNAAGGAISIQLMFFPWKAIWRSTRRKLWKLVHIVPPHSKLGITGEFTLIHSIMESDMRVMSATSKANRRFIWGSTRRMFIWSWGTTATNVLTTQAKSRTYPPTRKLCMKDLLWDVTNVITQLVTPLSWKSTGGGVILNSQNWGVRTETK